MRNKCVLTYILTQDYESIFGPAARDVKLDLQRNKRHARWHLPDALKGSNPWIADKIDGLITDTSSSPFTTQILPYLYIENVDQVIPPTHCVISRVLN